MATITKTYGSVTRLYEVDPIKVGVTCGRKASSPQELYQALKAHDLEPGTELFEEAHRAGLQAMKLTAMKAAQDAEDELK